MVCFKDGIIETGVTGEVVLSVVHVVVFDTDLIQAGSI